MNRTDVIAADVLDVCLKQAASPLILLLFLCPSFEILWNIESRAFDGNSFLFQSVFCFIWIAKWLNLIH